MSRVPEFSPKSPISLSPRPLLTPMFTSVLCRIADWDDGQQSRQSSPKLPKTTGLEDPLYPKSIWRSSGESSMSTAGYSYFDTQPVPILRGSTLNGTSSWRYGDGYMFPPSLRDIPGQSGPIVPATIDLESGLRSQAKKRKASIDTAQRFGSRKTNKSILEQEISQLKEQLQFVTKQRDLYHLERDSSREELSRHVGTQRVPLRPASPCNHTPTLGQSDDHSPLSTPDIPSTSGPTTPKTIDFKSGPKSQAERRKEANRDAQRRFRERKRIKAIFEQRAEQLREQLQSVTEQRDFYRLERDFFSEELDRLVQGTGQCPSHPASP
ncbi:hypothetical protein EIK77_008133 [Talaromyces pinophilus]|nr:hypothetical protein EIK77_008133 [Talaromyces pinophilus]